MACANVNAVHSRETIAPPEPLRAALIELFGPAVEQVGIVERSWFNLLHGAPRATTRRGRIYLRGSAEEFFADPMLVLHEYCHVLHQWEPRRLTVTRYARECLRCGYWMNPFEIEARRFAADNLHRLIPAMTRAGTVSLPPGSAGRPASDC
ncbi:MAG: hypothetical protein ABIT36_04025 [Steroidobacteraceae bacterium]